MKRNKVKKDKKHKNKADGLKINSSSSNDDNSDSEHELIYYESDRVKLMQKVLRTIKPKKIKAMAPDCIKDLDIDEINSMLLEELLGISRKRLKVIFAGKTLANESSSSDSEEDKLDVISLDDITTDDDLILLETDEPIDKKVDTKKKKHSKTKVKQEMIVKQENSNTKKSIAAHTSAVEEDDEEDEDRVMSVLELLELQARARAIRSQLALEKAEKKKKKLEKLKQVNVKLEDKDDSDSVIIESPKHEAIIIASDSEAEKEENIETSTIADALTNAENLAETVKDISKNTEEGSTQDDGNINNKAENRTTDADISKKVSDATDAESEIVNIVKNNTTELTKRSPPLSPPRIVEEIKTTNENSKNGKSLNDSHELEADEEIIINITDQDVIEL